MAKFDALQTREVGCRGSLVTRHGPHLAGIDWMCFDDDARRQTIP
jgi:hypothetical protein